MNRVWQIETPCSTDICTRRGIISSSTCTVCHIGAPALYGIQEITVSWYGTCDIPFDNCSDVVMVVFFHEDKVAEFQT